MNGRPGEFEPQTNTTGRDPNKDLPGFVAGRVEGGYTSGTSLNTDPNAIPSFIKKGTTDPSQGETSTIEEISRKASQGQLEELNAQYNAAKLSGDTAAMQKIAEQIEYTTAFENKVEPETTTQEETITNEGISTFMSKRERAKFNKALKGAGDNTVEDIFNTRTSNLTPEQQVEADRDRRYREAVAEAEATIPTDISQENPITPEIRNEDIFKSGFDRIKAQYPEGFLDPVLLDQPRDYTTEKYPPMQPVIFEAPSHSKEGTRRYIRMFGPNTENVKGYKELSEGLNNAVELDDGTLLVPYLSGTKIEIDGQTRPVYKKVFRFRRDQYNTLKTAIDAQEDTITNEGISKLMSKRTGTRFFNAVKGAGDNTVEDIFNTRTSNLSPEEQIEADRDRRYREAVAEAEATIPTDISQENPITPEIRNEDKSRSEVAPDLANNPQPQVQTTETTSTISEPFNPSSPLESTKLNGEKVTEDMVQKYSEKYNKILNKEASLTNDILVREMRSLYGDGIKEDVKPLEVKPGEVGSGIVTPSEGAMPTETPKTEDTPKTESVSTSDTSAEPKSEETKPVEQQTPNQETLEKINQILQVVKELQEAYKNDPEMVTALRNITLLVANNSNVNIANADNGATINQNINATSPVTAQPTGASPVGTEGSPTEPENKDVPVEDLKKDLETLKEKLEGGNISEEEKGKVNILIKELEERIQQRESESQSEEQIKKIEKAAEDVAEITEEDRRGIRESGKSLSGFLANIKRQFTSTKWGRMVTTIGTSLGGVGVALNASAVAGAVVTALGPVGAIAMGGAFAGLGIYAGAKTLIDLHKTAKSQGKTMWEMAKDKNFLKGAVVGMATSGFVKFGLPALVPGLGLLAPVAAGVFEIASNAYLENRLNKQQKELYAKYMDSYEARRYQVLKNNGYIGVVEKKINLETIIQDAKNTNLTELQRVTAVKAAIASLKYLYDQTKSDKYKYVYHTVTENGQEVVKQIDITLIGLQDTKDSTQDYKVSELTGINVESIIDKLDVEKLVESVSEAWNATPEDKKENSAKALIEAFVGLEAGDVESLLSDDKKKYLEKVAISTGLHTATVLVNSAMITASGFRTLSQGIQGLNQGTGAGSAGGTSRVENQYRQELGDSDAQVTRYENGNGEVVDAIDLDGDGDTDIFHSATGDRYVAVTNEGAEKLFEVQNPGVGDVQVNELTNSTTPIEGTLTDAQGKVVGVIYDSGNGTVSAMNQAQLANSISGSNASGPVSVSLGNISPDGTVEIKVGGNSFNTNLGTLEGFGGVEGTLETGGAVIEVAGNSSTNSLLHQVMADAKALNPNLAQYDDYQLERMMYREENGLYTNDSQIRTETGVSNPVQPGEQFNWGKSDTIIGWLEKLNNGTVTLPPSTPGTSGIPGVNLAIDVDEMLGINTADLTKIDLPAGQDVADLTALDVATLGSALVGALAPNRIGGIEKRNDIGFEGFSKESTGTAATGDGSSSSSSTTSDVTKKTKVTVEEQQKMTYELHRDILIEKVFSNLRLSSIRFGKNTYQVKEDGIYQIIENNKLLSEQKLVTKSQFAEIILSDQKFAQKNLTSVLEFGYDSSKELTIEGITYTKKLTTNSEGKNVAIWTSSENTSLTLTSEEVATKILSLEAKSTTTDSTGQSNGGSNTNETSLPKSTTASAETQQAEVVDEEKTKEIQRKIVLQQIIPNLIPGRLWGPSIEKPEEYKINEDGSIYKIAEKGASTYLNNPVSLSNEEFADIILSTEDLLSGILRNAYIIKDMTLSIEGVEYKQIERDGYIMWQSLQEPSITLPGQELAEKILSIKEMKTVTTNTQQSEPTPNTVTGNQGTPFPLPESTTTSPEAVLAESSGETTTESLEEMEKKSEKERKARKIVRSAITVMGVIAGGVSTMSGLLIPTAITAAVVGVGSSIGSGISKNRSERLYKKAMDATEEEREVIKRKIKKAEYIKDVFDGIGNFSTGLGVGPILGSIFQLLQPSITKAGISYNAESSNSVRSWFSGQIQRIWPDVSWPQGIFKFNFRSQ